MEAYFSDILPAMKALSDSTRLRIVNMLTYESMNAGELLENFELTQPTLSYHMKILTDAKLVTPARKGGYTVYSINRDTLSEVYTVIRTLAENCAI